MYCERCGKPIDEARNYCNSCGAQLKRAPDATKNVLSGLISALITVVAIGLGVLVGLIAILRDSVPNPEPVFVFAILYLAVLFGICFMIMRQISKVIDAKVIGTPSQSEQQVPLVQLPQRTTAQLEEFRQPASVVDHTTRTLDKIPAGER